MKKRKILERQGVPKMKSIALIGVGMIGGSLVSALKKAGAAKHIIGIDIDSKELDKAIKAGVIDEKLEIKDLMGLDDLDLIIIATPVGAMYGVFVELSKYNLTDDVLITDVGSTKVSVIESAKKAIGYLPKNFVPSHPIAGKEFSGIEFSDLEMFKGSKSIVTPHECSDEKAIMSVVSIWQSAGAIVDVIGAKEHDRILAATSHLPHVLAYTLVNSLVTTDYKESVFDYAAGGFKSLTRTASSSPVMWRDICLNNKDDILFWLDIYQDNLSAIRNMIEDSEGDKLENVFSEAKRTRDNHFS